MPLYMTLRHILVAAALPIGPSTTVMSTCEGPHDFGEVAACGPPSSIGDFSPRGLIGLMTATSTKRPPFASHNGADALLGPGGYRVDVDIERARRERWRGLRGGGLSRAGRDRRDHDRDWPRSAWSQKVAARMPAALARLGLRARGIAKAMSKAVISLRHMP